MAPEIPVDLVQRSVDVTGLEVPTEADIAALRAEEGAKVLPRRPNAVVVGWIGSACDERADVAVGRDPTGALVFGVRTWSTGEDCDGVAAPRAVIVAFSAAVEAPLGMTYMPCLIGRPDCQ